MPLDPESQAYLDLIKKLGRPPIDSLPPMEGKEVFRRGRMVTQPRAIASNSHHSKQLLTIRIAG